MGEFLLYPTTYTKTCPKASEPSKRGGGEGGEIKKHWGGKCVIQNFRTVGRLRGTSKRGRGAKGVACNTYCIAVDKQQQHHQPSVMWLLNITWDRSSSS